MVIGEGSETEKGKGTLLVHWQPPWQSPFPCKPDSHAAESIPPTLPTD